jgi:hypothetical protein
MLVTDEVRRLVADEVRRLVTDEVRRLVTDEVRRLVTDDSLLSRVPPAALATSFDPPPESRPLVAG